MLTHCPPPTSHLLGLEDPGGPPQPCFLPPQPLPVLGGRWPFSLPEGWPQTFSGSMDFCSCLSNLRVVSFPASSSSFPGDSEYLVSLALGLSHKSAACPEIQEG